MDPIFCGVRPECLNQVQTLPRAECENPVQSNTELINKNGMGFPLKDLLITY